MKVKVKVHGAGTVTHRCRRCGEPIHQEPVFVHHDGQLVAYHKEHEPWPQTHG